VPTIKTWLEGLGRRQSWRECPVWPPDLYAITGALLKRSGAYLRVFEHRPGDSYLENVRAEAAAWRGELDRLTDITVT
jgi:hypothetical protein